jgi:hypothetical protein
MSLEWWLYCASLEAYEEAARLMTEADQSLVWVEDVISE